MKGLSDKNVQSQLNLSDIKWMKYTLRKWSLSRNRNYRYKLKGDHLPLQRIMDEQDLEDLEVM